MCLSMIYPTSLAGIVSEEGIKEYNSLADYTILSQWFTCSFTNLKKTNLLSSPLPNFTTSNKPLEELTKSLEYHCDPLQQRDCWLLGKLHKKDMNHLDYSYVFKKICTKDGWSTWQTQEVKHTFRELLLLLVSSPLVFFLPGVLH